MDRLTNNDTEEAPVVYMSGIAIAQDDPFFQSGSLSFPANGHRSKPDVTPVSPYQLFLSRPSPRTTITASLLDPSDSLQVTILQSWRQTEPSQNIKDYCQRFLTQLTHTINSRFDRSGNRFKVDVFGSVSWGGEMGKSGDLDLVILDRDIPDGYRPSLWRTPPGAAVSFTSRSRVPVPIGGLSAVYNTFKLGACLTDAGMTQVQPIAAANTPIVKFVDPVSQMQCDINVNDLGGWFNSSLILHYCLLAPYLLRPMIHALKLWAAAFYVNDSSGQKGPATMSSYCLTLMAIAYLQHRRCLPNLQANVRVPAADAESDPDVVWVAWSREQGVPAHVAFNTDLPISWRSRDPNLTVADAIRGFFSFFSSRGQFQTERQVVSTLQGGVVPRTKSYGQVKNEETQFEQGLRDQGWSMDVMQAAKRARNAKFFEEEQEMGKGDRGVQPRKWSENRLVVQDPFLWQKNCASMMTNVGLARWQQAVDNAHRLLTTNSRATVEDLTFNPNPPENPTPRRTHRGGGGGGGGSGSSGRGSPKLSRSRKR